MMYHTKTYPGLQPIYSQNFLFRAGLSAVAGIFLGILVSLIVNCTLLEISLNAFFATYFGLLFSAVGAIILWRVRTNNEGEGGRGSGGGYGGGGSIDPFAQPGRAEAEARRRTHLQVFGALILFSGIMCFMLEKDWYYGPPLVLLTYSAVLVVCFSLMLE